MLTVAQCTFIGSARLYSMEVGIRGGDILAQARQTRKFQVKPVVELAIGANASKSAQVRPIASFGFRHR